MPNVSTAKYLGVILDRDLSWKASQRIRYISALFPGRCDRARIMLFQSLVMPLFDYCSTVCSPRLRCVIDVLESPVKRFLRTIQLGILHESSTDDHYCQRLKQIGWDCLVLRRIKLTLLLAYKLIVGIVPHGDLMFETLNSVLSAVSVAGSRRSQTQLQGHPLPIQFRKDQRDGNQSSPS